MKVVLLKDVKNIGARDDVVNVSDGYARNFLLPQRLAAEATPGMMKEVERKRAAKEVRDAESLAAAQEKASKLKNKVITLSVKCGAKGRLYGSVTVSEIAEALAKQHGIEIDKRKIELGDPVREVGDRKISVRICAGVVTPMILRVEALQA